MRSHCSDRALRGRCGGVGEGDDGRVLVDLSIEQIGNAAHEQAVHHEGDGKGGEFCCDLGIHERSPVGDCHRGVSVTW
jgi:hypothetical protein